MDALRTALDATPRPADAKHAGYGTAGFRGCAEGGAMDHIFLRCGALAYLRAAKLGSTAGCMVTASHNAEPDNGVKICESGGDMMAAAWEPYAAELANLETTDAVVSWIEALAEKEGFALGGAAEVYVGMDTRPTSPHLTALVVTGVEALGGTVHNYGLLTTPQLHHCVRVRNAAGGGVAAPPPEEGYFQQLVSAYQMVTPNASGSKLFVDCSKGIGAPKLAVLAERLAERLEIERFNVDGSVNEGCGAEHVQKGRVLPCGVDPAGDVGKRMASMDGDADRLVYFFVQPGGGLGLVDGDKIAVLFASFIKAQLDAAGLADDITVGCVQTAYANGASTEYLKSVVGVPVEFVPTGVKHLHKKAHDFDIGVYFEANGHGTVLFGPKALAAIEAAGAAAAAVRRPGAAGGDALVVLKGLTLLINQAVGDALSDLLAVEAILSAEGDTPSTIAEWDALYVDRPSRQLKVAVEDRTVVKPQWDEMRLVEPAALQDAVDAAVAACGEGARGFVRPSGTEDVVRVYAEASTQEKADELALALAKAIYDNAAGVGDLQTTI
jgi:phosphoacetylglucosamine mutase